MHLLLSQLRTQVPVFFPVPSVLKDESTHTIHNFPVQDELGWGPATRGHIQYITLSHHLLRSDAPGPATRTARTAARRPTLPIRLGPATHPRQPTSIESPLGYESWCWDVLLKTIPAEAPIASQ